MSRKTLPLCFCLLTLAAFLLPAGCPDGAVPSNNANSNDNTSAGALRVPADAIAAARIGAAGGALRVPKGNSRAAGVKIVVPPGALAAGKDADFYVRVVEEFGALDIAPDRIDAVRAAAQHDQPRDNELIHPLYASLVDARGTPLSTGPLLELGPEGIEFEKPIEIHIPFDRSRVSRADAPLMAVYTGEYDGSRTFAGERVPDVRVDYDAGVIVADVRHLSLWQSAYDVLTPLMQRILAGAGRIVTDVPAAPSLTDAMIGDLLCSGLRPHVNIGRLPDPIYLLYYLSTPMPAESRVVDPAQHAADRQFYETRRVVTGQEVALEDWVLGQTVGSVRCEALFGQAYRLVGGDVFQALLLTHNVLRGFDGANRYGDPRGVQIQQRMAPLRGDNDDEVGARYHYFGMATYAFIMRMYGHFSSDFYGGLGIPLIDVDEELVAATIYVEECIVSGDCLSDGLEYAIDLAGRDTGEELADRLFDGFSPENGAFPGISIAETARRYGLDGDACLTVEITGERTADVGENVSLRAVVTGGTQPHGVIWMHNGQTLMTGPEFFYAFSQAGEYVLRVRVTDGGGLETNTSATVTVAAPPAPANDYLVYYVQNVGCWDAPSLYVTYRSEFDAPRAIASFAGGGVDYSIPAVKVELQGGFATADDALAWLCPRFESRFAHYWCGWHVWMDGRYWWAHVACDLSGLPIDETYRE